MEGKGSLNKGSVVDLKKCRMQVILSSETVNHNYHPYTEETISTMLHSKP